MKAQILKDFWFEMITQAVKKLEVYKYNHDKYMKLNFFNLEKESLKDISNAKRLITFCIERYNNVECINL